MGERLASDAGRLGGVLEEGLRDDRPRCSEGEFDPLLEQLKRHHEIVGGVVRERVVPLVGDTG